jgi:lipopolysaccharide/colanic/teichoic acid biosynthesis glycosyltransferase
MSNSARLRKRIFDLAIAFPAAVLLSPVMLLTALAVAAKLGRPVLFRQVRPGLHGKPFTLVKFRTMLDSGVGNPPLLTDADRLTSFGRWLRSTSLDELPELWNVLAGDMSIVGPRPLLTQYLARYSPTQARRHEVPPGLTGWVQINGRNALSWDEKLRLDVWYVDNRSLGLDLKIVLATLLSVIRRDGITADGSATTTEFVGSGPSEDSEKGDGSSR